MPVETASLAEGATVGRFVIVRQLGSGGMGTVYEARDPELARSVAIKLVREPDHHLAMRLLREAQALAQLQHPNVVTVYELGLEGDQVFVAMELVAGESLEGYFARGRSSWRSVVAMFAQAANGLAAAHAKGLVHRDVKPANLFVDESGRVRVGDFGLAKLAADDAGDGDAAAVAHSGRDDVTASGSGGDTANGTEPSAGGLLASPLTRAGALLGTPMFMAPEQYAGRRGTAASDQFSFCVAMWRALFGVHPFAGSGTKFAETIITGVRHEVARGRVPRWLVRALDRGLAIDPARRHPSMATLARELERGMSRRRVIAASVIAVIAAIVAFSAWRVVVEMQRADREAAVARERADEAILAQAGATLSTDPTAAVGLLRQLGPGAPQWEAARTIAADAASRGVAHLLRHTGGSDVAFSPDGTRLASVGEGSIRIWDVATWSERAFSGPAAASAIAFARDGSVITVDEEGHIDRLDAAGATTRVRTITHGPFRRATIQPGGRRVAMFGVDGVARLVDLEGGELALPGHDRGAWSPDGASLVLNDRRRMYIVRADPATGALADVMQIQAISVATDGTRIWIGSWDGHLSEISSGRAIDWAADHTGPITTLAATPEAGVLSASANLRFTADEEASELRPADYTITISDRSPYRIAHLRGHDEEIIALAVARDGSVASLDASGGIRVWRRTPVVTIPHEPKTIATAAAITADRRALVVAKRGPVLDVRDLATGATQRMALTELPAGFVREPAIWHTTRKSTINGRSVVEVYDVLPDSVSLAVSSRDGRRIATLDSAEHAVVWDLDTRRASLVAEHASLLAIDGDGKRIATAHKDASIRAWDVATRGETRLGTITTATALAMSPDGSYVAATDSHGNLALFGPRPRIIEGANDHIHVLAFAPDGATLVGGGKRRTLEIWDVETGAVRSFRGHTGSITRLAFSPDGGRVASASGDGSIRVWRLADGSSTLLRGHTGAITSMRFRSDGRMLVSASDDHTVRLWDLASGGGRVLPGNDLFAAFTEDERHVVAVDRIDGIARYEDDLPPDEAGLAAWLAGFE